MPHGTSWKIPGRHHRPVPVRPRHRCTRPLPDIPFPPCCPTTLLKENSSPGCTIVPLIALAASFTFVFLFSLAVVSVVNVERVLYCSFAFAAELRLALIDLSLDHSVIIAACSRLHKILYKLLLVHSLARSSVRKQELICRSVILGDRTVLCLHIPLRRRVRRCLCRSGLQILRVFNREGILPSAFPVQIPSKNASRSESIRFSASMLSPVVGDRHLPRIFFFQLRPSPHFASFPLRKFHLR